MLQSEAEIENNIFYRRFQLSWGEVRKSFLDKESLNRHDALVASNGIGVG